jgi:hypothetical protein
MSANSIVRYRRGSASGGRVTRTARSLALSDRLHWIAQVAKDIDATSAARARMQPGLRPDTLLQQQTRPPLRGGIARGAGAADSGRSHSRDPGRSGEKSKGRSSPLQTRRGEKARPHKALIHSLVRPSAPSGERGLDANGMRIPFMALSHRLPSACSSWETSLPGKRLAAAGEKFF